MSLAFSLILISPEIWKIMSKETIVTCSSPHPTILVYAFQDPQWMRETTDSTEPFIYYGFSYKYVSFSLKEGTLWLLWYIHIVSITIFALWAIK